MAYNSFSELTEKIANGFGYEVEFNPTWYEEYKNDELTIFQTLSVLRAQRLTDEELFYYQRMQYLRYIPPLQERRSFAKSLTIQYYRYFNQSDERWFLKLESPYGSSFLTILPIGKLPVQFNGFHLGEFIQRLKLFLLSYASKLNS